MRDTINSLKTNIEHKLDVYWRLSQDHDTTSLWTTDYETIDGDYDTKKQKYMSLLIHLCEAINEIKN